MFIFTHLHGSNLPSGVIYTYNSSLQFDNTPFILVYKKHVSNHKQLDSFQQFKLGAFSAVYLIFACNVIRTK